MKQLIALFVLCFSLPSFAKLASTPYLSQKQFRMLKSSDRQAYINSIRKAFLTLEESQLKKVKVAKPSNFMILQLLESANASGMCLVGGTERPLVSGKCSTENNECDGRSNTFKCGPIFGGVCISRVPTASISRRCSVLAEQSVYISAENYSTFAEEAQAMKAKYCNDSKVASQPDCAFFLSKLIKLQEHYQQKADKATALGEQQGSSTSVTSAIPPNPYVSCLEADPVSNTCVKDTMTVRRNPEYENCKKSNKNCLEYELQHCVNYSYDMAISPSYLENYISKHQNESDVVGFAQAIGLSVDDTIQFLKNAKGKIHATTDTFQKNKLVAFAEAHNRRINACQEIAELKTRVEKNNELIAACKKQEESFNSKELNISELASIGQKNTESVKSYSNRCLENKPTHAQAVKLVYKCSSNESDNCIARQLRIFPTSFEWKKTDEGDRGQLEYIDSAGRASKVIIVKDEGGQHQVLQSDGTAVKIATIKTIAPCKVARVDDIPLEWKQSSECYPLAQYSMDKEHGSGSTGKKSGRSDTTQK